MGEVRHPTPESLSELPEGVRLTAEIERSESSVGTGILAEHSAKLRAAQELFTIGVPEGEPHEMIGALQDIAVNAEGRIYILDAQFHEIKIYDPEGRFLRAYGKPGQGPDEFYSPEAIEWMDQRIYVADKPSSVTVLSETGETIQEVTTLQLDFTPMDICLLRSQFYGQGFSPEKDHPTHRYTLEGVYESSFGHLYDTAMYRTKLHVWPFIPPAVISNERERSGRSVVI